MVAMISLMKTKRAMLYTLTLSLFALGVLSLAFVSYEFSQSNESIYTELSSAFYVYDLHSSISTALSSAFTHENTTYFVTTNTSILVQEQLPVDFSTLDALMTSLKNRTESDFSIVNISIDSEHRLYFLPMNVSLRHVASDHIMLSGHANITGYNMTLKFSGIISSCSQSSSVGTLHLELYIMGGGSNCTFNQNIDEFQVSISGVGATLEIDDGVDFQSNSTVQVGIMANLVQQPTIIDVKLPATIAVREPVFGFEKNAFVEFPRS